jgi:hypothetical protein
MLRRHLFATAVILSCTIASAAPLASQSGAQVDPLSGLWGRKDGAGLDLKFDGHRIPSGHQCCHQMRPNKTRATCD